MDHLFLNSVWSREYNRSEVVSLSDGSLLVRARFHLNTPDTSAAKNLGSAFLRGLQKRHSQEWLGMYTVDITSIRFAEVAPPSSPTPPTTTEAHRRTLTRGGDTGRPGRRPDVGWGEWGPWSSCSPCSPQYDQIRTRKCRLEDGKGILVSNIELCLPEGHAGHLQGSRGNMESRPCQCHHSEPEEEEEEYVEEEEEPESTTEVPASGRVSSSSTLRGKSAERETEDTTEREDSFRNVFRLQGICETCEPGEVCVSLAEDDFPTCRPEQNPGDPTGCGGLCIKDIEVCQALGSRAFQCHSASQCLDDEWRCADGLCIPQAKRCDGHLNCYDRSDENMCTECSSEEFHCGNQTSCVPLSAKCDGNVDCWDGLDEANCTDGTDDASQLPPSVTGTTRVGTSVMNRTAIGLSSLSHRERELLS
ncbi:UNVERIFIED_CONTAM: hypothetical protein GTU68_043186 [Idotea baltica]|nr:hypothetical protein [Idotea baltica]